MTYTVCDLPSLLSVRAAGMDSRSMGGAEPMETRRPVGLSWDCRDVSKLGDDLDMEAIIMKRLPLFRFGPVLLCSTMTMMALRLREELSEMRARCRSEREEGEERRGEERRGEERRGEERRICLRFNFAAEYRF
jgi:hypothetical protein